MITKTSSHFFSSCALSEQLPPLADSALFDIETTGFSPKNSHIYLIGVLIFRDGHYEITQWLAKSSDDEPAILLSFLNFVCNFRFLLHFNGDAFDLPFLRKRCEAHNIPLNAKLPESFDLYRQLRPLKRFLMLPAMNLTSLEAFLSISREDSLDGGRLIPVYRRFSSTKDEVSEKLLLLHNHDDLIGTAALFPLFSYLELWNGNFTLSAPPALTDGDGFFTLTLSLALPTPVPQEISLSLRNALLTVHGRTAVLSVRGICDTLKYFFPDYKNYYYFPYEDTAMHKSVAAYADKKHRVPAKASTCYCKKSGRFLPGINLSSSVHFFHAYGDADFYLECSEDFLSSPDILLSYAKELIRQ